MMRPKTYAFFYFFSTIAAVIVTLLLLNWIPLALQKDMLRRYDSIEDARAKLNLKDVLVPSYFPQPITWPPTEVLAQTRPYPGVLMAFNLTGGTQPALLISQAFSDGFPGRGFMTLTDITEKVQYRLKDRDSLLEVGTCGTEAACSRISWTEGPWRVTVIMRSSPFELIRIAQSMLR